MKEVAEDCSIFIHEKKSWAPRSLKVIHSQTTVAVRWPGKERGAIAFALNFWLHLLGGKKVVKRPAEKNKSPVETRDRALETPFIYGKKRNKLYRRHTMKVKTPTVEIKLVK